MRKMEMITVYVPRGLLNKLDDLVSEGYYPNRSEAIREAIRDLVNYHEKSGKNYAKNNGIPKEKK